MNSASDNQSTASLNLLFAADFAFVFIFGLGAILLSQALSAGFFGWPS
ncbi:hypothetical protein [Cerasicoccus frondis]|nr:hypothetical protein [Cerasicoccus frondis]